MTLILVGFQNFGKRPFAGEDLEFLDGQAALLSFGLKYQEKISYPSGSPGCEYGR